MVEVYDENFSMDDMEKILSFCKNSSYTFGETDTDVTPPTGMVCNIKHDEPCIKIIIDKIMEMKPIVKTLKLERVYINCFAPSENPYFHVDNMKGGLTFIYYPDMQYSLDELGETQILDNRDLIIGIKPRGGRILCFDSRLMHRATPFRTKHRFTIAVKYSIAV